MANFFDQFDSGASAGASSSNFFDQFDEGSQQPANNEGNFTRGLKNSFRQLPQLGYGIEAIAGATGEKLAGEGGLFTGLKQHGIKNYQREAEELAPFSKENDSISTAWEKAKGGDIGALGDFGGYGLGYVTGQGAQALATAGVGKLLAQQGVKAVAPSIIEAVTAKEAAKLAGKGLAESEVQQIAAKNALAKIGTYGANTALAANALGMEGGEIGGGMVANAEQRGTPLTGEELVKGGLSTLGAGALEYLGDKIGIDAAFGKMPIGKALSEAPGVSGRVGRGLVGGAMAAVPEAGTEYGQTMLEQYGQGQDPFSAESQRQAIDAAALGALGGQVMGGAGGLVSSAQPKVVEKPISDGPLGNAAAAGGITQTEISDAGTTNQEALIPEQNLGGSSGAVLPASNGLGEPNDAMPEPESLVDQTGAATTGNEAEPAIATQQAPSPVDFQPTHLADDGTPVAYREDDQGPYFETADGQQWDYTDTATPITQETVNDVADNKASESTTEESSRTPINNRVTGEREGQMATGYVSPDSTALDNNTATGWAGDTQDQFKTAVEQEAINANNPDGNAVTDNSQTTGENRGIGSDQRGFDTSLEPTDGRADDRGINGVDGQLRGGESPSDVESGGALSPSSIVNTQYLTDNGVTESDISRIDQALNNNPGLAQKPLGFIRGFLKDKYQGLDYSQVIQDVSTQQSPASSLDAATAQSQPDAGLVSSQPGNLNAQAPETQPVLPDTGANQTGNAAPMGVGQGQSAVSGQEEVRPNERFKVEGLTDEAPVYGAQKKGHAKVADWAKPLVDSIPFYAADAKPSEETKQAARKIPTFQGGKTKVAYAATEKIKKLLGGNADKITTIDDYFGGSGSWSSYIATVTHKNVKQIRLHEMNPQRMAKIKLFHEQGNQIRDLVKQPLISEALTNLRDLVAQDGTTSGSGITNRIERALQISSVGQKARSQYGDDIVNGLFQAIRDQGDASFGQYGRNADEAIAKILERVANNAEQAHAQADVLRQRGVKYEYVVGDSYQAPSIKGNHVLALVDPPYYNTKGYNGMDKVPMETYNETRKLLQRLAGESNSILYTDEAWFDKDEKGQTAQPADLSKAVDGLDAVGQLQAIRGTMHDFFRLPVGNRVETLGIYDGHRTKPTNAGLNSSIVSNGRNLANDVTGTASDVLRGANSNLDAGTDGTRQGLPAQSTGGGLRRRGAGVKLSVSTKPTLTALFNQLGKLKAAEKANKDVKALIDAHPKAELIRHVQNHWTDVLVQHEKNSDNPNGKVTIQC